MTENILKKPKKLNPKQINKQTNTHTQTHTPYLPSYWPVQASDDKKHLITYNQGTHTITNTHTNTMGREEERMANKDGLHFEA